MDGNYSAPFEMPEENFVAMRSVSQVLSQRAKCDLVLNQPDKALDEITFLNHFRRILEHPPSGKPINLVDAMINTAIVGLYAETIASGFESHTWQKPQLIVLEGQLQNINLFSTVSEGFRTESASISHDIETLPSPKWSTILKDRSLFEAMPRGWLYQNMVVVAKSDQRSLDNVEITNEFLFPKKTDSAMDGVAESLQSYSPFKIWASVATPNFAKAWRTAAYNQTLVNEAQIACALELYYLTNGQYPIKLETLTPGFMKTIPSDVINGWPLHYQREAAGKFILYSVGWNETDDGGRQSPYAKSGGINYTNGDWVWPN
jgi:hypothetical protein